MQRRLTAAGAEAEKIPSAALPFIAKTAEDSFEKTRKSRIIPAVSTAFTNLEAMKGKSGILLSSVMAQIWRITDIPEKESIAPARTIPEYPPTSAQERHPEVTSKMP